MCNSPLLPITIPLSGQMHQAYGKACSRHAHRGRMPHRSRALFPVDSDPEVLEAPLLDLVDPAMHLHVLAVRPRALHHLGGCDARNGRTDVRLDELGRRAADLLCERDHGREPAVERGRWGTGRCGRVCCGVARSSASALGVASHDDVGDAEVVHGIGEHGERVIVGRGELAAGRCRCQDGIDRARGRGRHLLRDVPVDEDVAGLGDGEDGLGYAGVCAPDPEHLGTPSSLVRARSPVAHLRSLPLGALCKETGLGALYVGGPLGVVGEEAGEDGVLGHGGWWLVVGGWWETETGAGGEAG